MCCIFAPKKRKLSVDSINWFRIVRIVRVCPGLGGETVSRHWILNAINQCKWFVGTTSEMDKIDVGKVTILHCWKIFASEFW